MILDVNEIKFSYPGRNVLQNIGFSLQKGDCVAILGTNGTGKSTLLKCLDRILKPQGGTVTIEGRDFSRITDKELAQEIGYVAQNQPMARCTVFDSVLLGRKPYIRWNTTEEDIDIVNETLDSLGLAPYAMRYTDELSGGELQKVVIARALAQEPAVLLLDEPTSNLDMKNQLDTIHVIKEIVKTKEISVVVTMHDLNLAMRFANKFLLLKGGEVFAAGGEEIITQENIQEVYGVDVVIHQLCGYPIVVPI